MSNTVVCVSCKIVCCNLGNQPLVVRSIYYLTLYTGGHRNVEEEREKIRSAQLVALERAQMAAKRYMLGGYLICHLSVMELA